MKKIALTIAAALLALPALAHAKAGIEFDQYPDNAKVGEAIPFTVMAMNEPPSGGHAPRPVVGRHPLLTFRSDSGRVVRVRASATDLNGLAYGKVAFPDKGPWSTELRIGDRMEIGPEMSEPIHVGIGLTQTIPPAKPHQIAPKPAPAPADSSGAPWVWIFSLGAIGSALLVLLMRRRGHWGAA